MTHNNEAQDQCKTNKCCGKLWAATILALGIALGGFFPGYYYYQAKLKDNFVTVKGLAEMDAKADLGVWNIKFVVTGDELVGVQKDMSNKLQIILGFLKEKGFSVEEISEGRTETNDLMTNPYRDKNFASRYILSQTVTVRSNKVDMIEQALRTSGELVAKGVVFDSQSYGSPVSYIFTKLNDVKPQMLEEATKNARQAAEEFAKSSGSEVGKIRRASQGVFSIQPLIATPDAVESYQINKKIRVVSTVEFWLN